MRLIVVITIPVLMLFSLAGCELVEGADRIEGQISWEDGGALPAGSTVTVRIVNASLADAVETLTLTTFEAEGSPPLDFWVEYDEAAVDDRMNYAATVRIEDSNGQLIYITQTTQIVIQRGEPVEPVRILVEPV